MALMKEVRRQIKAKPKASICCTPSEDNAGANKISQVPKMRPRTKNLNVKYHHFREHVNNGGILGIKHAY